MADRLRPILDGYLAGGMPPNIALMRLCIEAASPEEVRAAIDQAAESSAGHLSPVGRGRTEGPGAGERPILKGENLLTPTLSPPGRGSRAESSPPPTAAERLAALSSLLASHPAAWATIRTVMREAEHDRQATSAEEAVAHWSAVFDRLAEAQPEAGVALYALGSPALLEAATAEIVGALRGWGLLAPHSRVLEIGCGIGRFVRALAPQVGHVTGLDVSREMIAQARDRCAGLANICLEVSSGRDLAGLADCSFDLVLAADVFPYLVQAGRELAEWHVKEAGRVLRPGGTLAILNHSYRGDLELDRSELTEASGRAGFASVEEPRPIFQHWDGFVFLLRKPA